MLKEGQDHRPVITLDINCISYTRKMDVNKMLMKKLINDANRYAYINADGSLFVLIINGQRVAFAEKKDLENLIAKMKEYRKAHILMTIENNRDVKFSLIDRQTWG